MEILMKLPLFFLISFSFLTGCTTPVSTISRPEGYYEASNALQPPASLFSDDASTLSDEAIQRILNYEYKPPELIRIALMPFDLEVWSTWSEELAVASERMRKDVLASLRASNHVYDASFLPSILVPKNRTVPHLREAAARYQADLLLVYRSFCRSFERYRFLAANETRAFCGAEAVLLDTRTGLVPFTVVTTRSFDVVQSRNDMNFRETQRHAQLEATAAAMADVSTAVVQFLSKGRTATEVDSHSRDSDSSFAWGPESTMRRMK